MPVYITPQKVKMRELNGEHSDKFYGLDTVAENSIAENVAAITNVANTTITTLNNVANTVQNWLDNHPEVTTTVQDHSLTYEKLVNGTLNFVTPEMFGAVGDGAAADGAAVQLALNSGKIVVANGVYNISTNTPYTNRFYLHIPDGVHIIGGTYKFPNDGISNSNYSMFLGDSFTFENATFDMNGYNNLDGLSNHPMYAVYIVNCKNTRIINCHFKNSAGRNYIYAYSGSDLVIENCTFKNGGTNLQGSDVTKQNDFSYVYASAENTKISKCTIFPPDNDPFTYCGGFEIHNSNSIVSECQINKCLPAIYIAPKSNPSDTSANINVKILNNAFLNCQGGVSCFANHTLNNIDVSGNFITLSPVTPVQASMYGIGATRDTLSNFNAVGNTILQGDASSYGCTGISFSNATSVNVANNILTNIPQPIFVSGNDSNTDVTIEHNLIKASTSISNYAVTRENTSAAIRRLTIRDNTVVNYVNLINSINKVNDYFVIDRIFEMDYLIERSKNMFPVGEKTTENIYGVDMIYKNGIVSMSGTGTQSGGRQNPISPYFTLAAGSYSWKFTGTKSVQAFIAPKSSPLSAITSRTTNQEKDTFTLDATSEVFLGINVGPEDCTGTLYFELESGETVGPFIPSGAYTAVDAVARAAIS